MLSVTHVSEVCPVSIFTDCKNRSRLLQNIKKSDYSIITKNTQMTALPMWCKTGKFGGGGGGGKNRGNPPGGKKEEKKKKKTSVF